MKIVHAPMLCSSTVDAQCNIGYVQMQPSQLHDRSCAKLKNLVTRLSTRSIIIDMLSIAIIDGVKWTLCRAGLSHF